MTVYTDNLNNYFLGNVSISNNDPITDTPNSSAGTDLSSICSSSGLRTRNIALDADFNGMTPINMLHFGANLDGSTIDDRILFVSGAYGGTGLQDNRLYMFNNSGGTLTATANIDSGATNLTNQVYKTRSHNIPSSTTRIPNWGVTGNPVYWAGVCDGNSLALVQFSVGGTSASGFNLELKFWYGGLLLNPDASLTTNSSKYVTIIATALTINRARQDVEFYRRVRCYLGNETFPDIGYTTGHSIGADYTFTCSNGTIPNKQWVKDFIVKNGTTEMGKARNLLIGTGSYELLRPLKVLGTGGEETWLPVCHYCTDPYSSAYTILMRCKSSYLL